MTAVCKFCITESTQHHSSALNCACKTKCVWLHHTYALTICVQCVIFLSCRCGSANEFAEKETLLNELVELQREKEQVMDKDKQAAKQQREQAAQLREDACATLGEKWREEQKDSRRSHQQNGAG